MTAPVVLEDNTFAQACKVHGGGIPPPPCTGEYFGPVLTPGQDRFKVNGKRVVLAQQTHTYGCPDCSSDRVIVNQSPVLKVNGVPVALAGTVTGLHSNGPIAGSSGFKA